MDSEGGVGGDVSNSVVSGASVDAAVLSSDVAQAHHLSHSSTATR